MLRIRRMSRASGALVVAAALLAPAAAYGTGSLPGNQEGRMTGGGSFFTSKGARITHGFELRCPGTNGPQRLEVNWGKGNRFHLTDLPTNRIRCTDSAEWEEGNPEAGFDTYRGVGTGRLNGKAGATIDFKFGDGGERGTEDIVRMIIRDADGNLVLGVVPQRKLHFGNHQAHGH